MTKHSHEHAENDLHQEDAVKPSRFGIGLLIGLLSGAIFGGLAGAGTMLLMAPQSGKTHPSQAATAKCEAAPSGN